MAARAPRPEDLYDLRVPTDLALSPDGRFVAFGVKSRGAGQGRLPHLAVARARRRRRARAPADRRQRRATPRRAGRPDGRTLAFLSDRGGGPPGRRRRREARQGRGAEGGRHPGLAAPVRRWRRGAPADRPAEGRRGPRLVARRPAAGRREQRPTRPSRRRSPSASPTIRRRRTRGSSTRSLPVQRRGLHPRPVHAACGSSTSRPATAELLTRGDHHDGDPQWSPDGRQIAFVSDRHPNPDLGWRSDVYVVDVPTRRVRQRLAGPRPPGAGARRRGRRTAAGSPPSARATGSAASSRRHRSGASACATAWPRTSSPAADLEAARRA